MWLSHELGDFQVSTKTDSLSVTHCKVYINLVLESKCPILNTKVATKVCFVWCNSHGFSFVFWGTTCLQRKFWPSMNQFFESLYQKKAMSQAEDSPTIYPASVVERATWVCSLDDQETALPIGSTNSVVDLAEPHFQHNQNLRKRQMHWGHIGVLVYCRCPWYIAKETFVWLQSTGSSLGSCWSKQVHLLHRQYQVLCH